MRQARYRRTLGMGALVLGFSGCLPETKSTTDTQTGTKTEVAASFTVVPDTSPGASDGTTQADTGTQVVSSGGNQTIPGTSGAIEEGFQINGGSEKTTDANLSLNLVTLNRHQMKITQNSNCSGGTWEAWSSPKVITAGALNSRVTVSVQYRDWDHRVTPCYVQSIVHDNEGPEIIISNYPTVTVPEGSTAQLNYSINDPNGIESAECSLNGTVSTCRAGDNVINVTAMPAGNYRLDITAQDTLGNSSTRWVSWSVSRAVRILTQNVDVNASRKVDILVVIDNSGSMGYEQSSMAQRVQNMLSVIRGLDWQIGITTTDPRSTANGGDGKLLPITGGGGRYILDSSMNEASAQTQFGNTVQTGFTGSGSEQGINATYRAVERSQSTSDPNHQALFRTGSHFAVVLISDEDESANTVKNDPNNLLQLVHNTWNGQKAFSFHSIITKPGDTQCRSTYGAAYGNRYQTMSNLTGGIIGSVCETDYAAQLAGIGQGVRNTLKVITLQCPPIQSAGITVTLNGSPYTAQTPSVDGVNLVFPSELPPGSYQVVYQCNVN